MTTERTNNRPYAGNLRMPFDAEECRTIDNSESGSLLCVKNMEVGRLFCLDILRGMVMLLLTVVGPIVRQGIFEVYPPSEGVLRFWTHSTASFASSGVAPAGFGIWDFAQPLFIFVCGAAVPLSIPKRLDAGGHPTMAFWKHVLYRVVLLWCLGMLIRGILTFDLAKFCPYADTLQTIAVAYLGASLAQLVRRRSVRFAAALVTIATFGVVQATCGDYSQMGNISRIIDERLFAAIGCKGKDFCYILTTPVWAAMGVLGSLATDVLREDRPQWVKLLRLVAWGMASLALGWMLQIWIPPIRYIYTVSFIFTTFGYATLLYGLLYVVNDILKFRRGAWLFLLFGQCSLAAWMLSTFFSPGVSAVAAKFIPGLPRLLGTDAYQPLALQLAYAAVFILILCIWQRYRTKERREKWHA